MFDNEFLGLDDEVLDQVISNKARRGRKGWALPPDLDDLKNEEEEWLDTFVHEL